MNCATGKGVTVRAKDKRYPTSEIRKLDGETTSGTRISSGYEITEALVRQQQQQTTFVNDIRNKSYMNCGNQMKMK